MPTIKTDFVISGEKQYKQAISEINSGLGVLNSEMKKVTAQYQDNANSVEALTAKGDVLERTLLSQKEKVEELRRALANAKEQYGEADKRTMEWEKSLNNAEAAVANTESAIRKNNDALEKAKSGMTDAAQSSEGLGGKIQDLASQFGIKLPGGIDKALGSTQGFSAGSVAAIGAVTVAVTTLINVYKQLYNMTMEAAGRADDILTLAKVTGLDTDTIQEMQYAAELIDVSFDLIQSSLTKLKANMQNAQSGNDKMIESFNKLGVSVTNADGSLRDAETVFYETIDALGHIENVTERDALAMEIFGRKAEELNPLIMAGSGKLKELAKEAENVNYIMSGETLEALGAVDDSYQRLLKTQEAVNDEMAGELAPSVEELHKTWAEFCKEGGELLVDSGIIKGLGEILKTTVDLLDPFTTLFELMTPAKDQFSLVYEVLHGIAMTLAWIEDTADAFIGLFTYLFDGGERYNTALGLNAGRGQFSHMQQLNGDQARWESAAQSSYYNPATGRWEGNYTGQQSSGVGWTEEDYGRYQYDEASDRWYDSAEHRWIPGHATGTMYFVGGRTVVGEDGPEVVDLPEGSRIWNAQDTRMGAGAGGVTINGDVFLDASKVQDLVDAARFLEDLRVVRRMR